MLEVLGIIFLMLIVGAVAAAIWINKTDLHNQDWWR